jgi:hypothetical protein
MGLWTRITGALGLKTGGSIDAWFSEFGGSRSTAGISVNQLFGDAGRHRHVLRLHPRGGCGQAAGACLSHAQRRRPRYRYRASCREASAEPNDFQSRFEFIEQMQAALLLRGNAYAPIIRDGRGRPIALIPVNPDRVSIYESPDGSVSSTWSPAVGPA